MTDIDYKLAKEIGATHYRSRDGSLYKEVNGTTCYWADQCWTETQLNIDISKRGLLKSIQFPEEPQWNGEGLPPAGALIEFSNIYGNEDFKDLDGLECEVISTGKNGVNDVVTVAFKLRGWRAFGAECFRPIRSQEEIERERFVESAYKSLLVEHVVDTAMAKAMAETLFNTGLYRLQEAE